MRILLFSGGLDSTALAYWLRPDQLIFFDYGQISANGEQRAASQLAIELGIPLTIKSANCRSCGSGELVEGPVLSPDAPEFWPYRNQLLITLAAMAYAAFSPLDILIGTVSSDTIHPDGRAEFVKKMEKVLICQGDVRLSAPALEMTSSELLELADVPHDLLAWTFSCHRSNHACGQCRGCEKHFQALLKLAK